MSESEAKKAKLEELQRVCLIVIDGWGVAEEKEGNAVFHAKTPVMDHLEHEYPVRTAAPSPDLLPGLF